MAYAYYFSDAIYFYNGTSWVNITADAIGDMSCEYGISGHGPSDRIADAGTLTFQLRNDTGKYTPYHISALTGWGKGAPISLYIDGHNKFYGWIETIQIETGGYGRQSVTVSVVDWMDHAAEFPMPQPSILLNKRANEVIQQVMAYLPKQPNSHNLSTEIGETIFPTAFDTLDNNTKAYSEIAKVVNSELGYAYIRHRSPYPNEFIFENGTHRNGLSQLSYIPLDETYSDILLKEDGDQLLLETGDAFLINALDIATFDNSMLRMDVTYGEALYNRIKLSTYPKRVDTSVQVLFSLDSPIQLVPSVIPYEFSASYKDPTGGSDRVTGINMIAPVATTDYKMFANEDGTGTDLTANLSVTVTYGVNGAAYTIRNTGSVSGYVTLLQARGYGIYATNPLDIIEESTSSQVQHGEYEASIDQKYLSKIENSMANARSLLAQNKSPRTVLEGVEFNANRDPKLRQAFLRLDIGDLIEIKESKSATNGWYWIQSISWKYSPGGIITYRYGVKEHISLNSGSLKLVKIRPIYQYADLSPASAVDYGVLTRLHNLPKRTITGWTYAIRPQPLSRGYRMWMGLSTQHHGIFSSVNPTSDGLDTVLLTVDGFFTDGSGTIVGVSWESQTHAAGVYDTWHFVAIETDWVDNWLSYPKMFIDGVESVAIKMSGTPNGPQIAENGVPLTLANVIFQNELKYVNQFPGFLKDIRIYNRLLTSAEILKIYTDGAGIPTVTDGLLFQGPCVRTQESAAFGGTYITAEDKFYDNMYLAIGNPVEPTNIHVEDI